MNNFVIFADVNGSVGLGRYSGPYRIATELRKNGSTVKVVDFMMSFTNEEIMEVLIKNKKPNVQNIAGFSSTFLLSRDFDVYLNRTSIRDHSENSSSIGLPVKEAQELVDKIRSIGYEVIIGGAKLKYDLENVKWIKGTAETRFSNNFNFTESVVEYTKEDHIFENEHLPLEIARGCIFKCSFCSYDLNGKKLWEFCKSPEVIKNEMLKNYINHGTTGYMFSDDTYNDSPEKVKQLLDMYKTLPFDLEFSAYARFDLMLSKPETIPMLIESGMKSVFFGIETFNHDSGKAIGKGMNPDRIKEGLINLKKEYPELLVCTGFIAGLPHDTEESLTDTVEWLKNSPVDSYSFQVLSLGKGSHFSNNMDAYGYKIDSNGKWYTKNLNHDIALSIAQSSETKSLSSFTFYNRLRNLDYSQEEIRFLNEKNKLDIEDRKNKKVNQYKSKILS